MQAQAVQEKVEHPAKLCVSELAVSGLPLKHSATDSFELQKKGHSFLEAWRMSMYHYPNML